MKATLEFDMDDPWERLEHSRSVRATQAYLVIHSFAEYLRQLDRNDQKEDISVLRQVLCNTCEEYSIDMGDLP